MIVILSVLAIVGILAVGWLATRPPSEAQFTLRVYSLLEELGLDLDKVDIDARSRFARECKAVHYAKKRFNPKRLAILLFTWQITRQSLAYAGLAEGKAVTDAILLIQLWHKQDKSLDGLAQSEINKLVTFVSQEIENSHLPRERIIEAQIDLLSLLNGTTVTEKDLERMADEIVEEHKRSMP